MNERALSGITAALETERTRLEAEVAASEAADRELLSEASGENPYRDHMADQGTATFERELDLTLEGNLRDNLEDVRNALARIADGTYGVCGRCGSQIPVDRLEALPTTNLCIRCKAEEETL